MKKTQLLKEKAMAEDLEDRTKPNKSKTRLTSWKRGQKPWTAGGLRTYLLSATSTSGIRGGTLRSLRKKALVAKSQHEKSAGGSLY